MPELIKELDFHAEVGGLDDIGAGPFGHRMIAAVSGGEFVGDRIRATVIGAGGDWLLLGADGFARLDVRLAARTSDGAMLYLHYPGLLEMTPGVLAILDGADVPTQFGDQYFFTTPRIETGDERYAWVNHTVFVGEGRLLPGPRVEYRLYRVADS